jgi:ATP-dependent RNA helicase RhlE
MVFVGNIKLADKLFAQLTKVFGEELSLIHSGKSQVVRFATLENFHKGLNRILIATDIAARGLDILEVSHVINFDTPKEAGDYIHRIGRTGRAGKAGTAITFFNEVESPYLESIEALMKLSVTRKRIPKEVPISSIFTEDELPQAIQKSHNKNAKKKDTRPVVHEKKAKNKKENLGGPRKRNPNKTKPRNRAVERNRARKK